MFIEEVKVMKYQALEKINLKDLKVKLEKYMTKLEIVQLHILLQGFLNK